MRSFILLTVLILLGGFGYIGFSVLTYEAETPIRYDLTPPSAEDEIAEKKALELSPEDQKRKDEIMSFLKTALDAYNTEWSAFPVQVSDVSLALLSAIQSNDLPTFYPISSHSNTPSVAEYRTIMPVSAMIQQVPENMDEGVVSIAQCETGSEGFILGDTGRNTLSCKKPTREKFRLYFSGPGDDTINVRGNALINSGSGNDVIEVGPEFTMIYVEPNFGMDSIKMDCTKANEVASNSNPAIPDWKYDFKHFLIFDSRIAKDDVSVSGTAIRHDVTGDQITLNENCLNIVFLSEE
ncbi:MAG: hypothetical protein ACPG05_02455 [Bdellovibrionales bacterium]